MRGAPFARDSVLQRLLDWAGRWRAGVRGRLVLATARVRSGLRERLRERAGVTRPLDPVTLERLPFLEVLAFGDFVARLFTLDT